MKSPAFSIICIIAFILLTLVVYFVNKDIQSYLERRGGRYREEQLRQLYEDTIKRSGVTPVTVQL